MGLKVLAACSALTAALAVTAAAAQLAPVTPRVSGERYGAVTQATIRTTICVRGWTATIRPPSGFTSPLKRWQIKTLGYADTDPSHYQEDHLISLEVGGAPYSSHNLWPEPIAPARRDDHGIESQLHAKICDGTMTLRQAQRAEIEYKRTNG